MASFVLLLLFAPASRAAATAAVDFSRYQVILERKPFGEPPPDSQGGSGVVARAESFIKDLRMVAITEDGKGEIKVGFVNIKDNKSYYLKVGESDDEIQVVDADYGTESALLKKGMDEQWINMNGDAASGGTQPGASAPTVASPSDTAAGARVPYPERQRRRRDAARVRVVEPPKLSGEELDKHLKEYQMNLIRKRGEDGPPLPMELTPEMDAQLVSEGVLPPGEQAQQPDGGAGGETPAPASEQ